MSKTKEDIINWFLENFEDPTEHTPYDSKEGGYIYIFGGPYDAREEIENNFTEVSSEILDEIIKELEYISLDWARIPNEEYIHDYSEKRGQDINISTIIPLF